MTIVDTRIRGEIYRHSGTRGGVQDIENLFEIELKNKREYISLERKVCESAKHKALSQGLIDLEKVCCHDFRGYFGNDEDYKNDEGILKSINYNPTERIMSLVFNGKMLNVIYQKNVLEKKNKLGELLSRKIELEPMINSPEIAKGKIVDYILKLLEFFSDKQCTKEIAGLGYKIIYEESYPYMRTINRKYYISEEKLTEREIRMNKHKKPDHLYYLRFNRIHNAWDQNIPREDSDIVSALIGTNKKLRGSYLAKIDFLSSKERIDRRIPEYIFLRNELKKLGYSVKKDKIAEAGIK